VTPPSQVSVTVALPKAFSMAMALGLHVVIVPLEGVPVVVITGPVVSAFQVIILVAVAVLPQLSVAVHVRVWDLLQVGPVMALSADVTVADPPQLSVAVAVPKAVMMAALRGLHPILVVDPLGPLVREIVGGVVLDFQVTVLLMGTAENPQALVAVQVLVWDLVQVPVIALSR
jgi:hypothetical protein